MTRANSSVPLPYNSEDFRFFFSMSVMFLHLIPISGLKLGARIGLIFLLYSISLSSSYSYRKYYWVFALPISLLDSLIQLMNLRTLKTAELVIGIYRSPV